MVSEPRKAENDGVITAQHSLGESNIFDMWTNLDSDNNEISEEAAERTVGET
jgi:hypothetical protein